MKLTLITFASLIMLSCSSQTKTAPQTSTPKPMDTNYNKTDAEWKKTLSEEEYYVLREKGTERPFTGKYNLHFEKGIYKCSGCGYELFKDDQKFESHCGWPSFDSEIGNGERIKKITDNTLGMSRTEIVCARCNGHLGHIFDDGPTKTGMRYCINSVSIDFEPEKTK